MGNEGTDIILCANESCLEVAAYQLVELWSGMGRLLPWLCEGCYERACQNVKRCYREVQNGNPLSICAKQGLR